MEPIARIEVWEEPGWRNPLRELPGKARPYLGGEAWARVSGSPADRESREVLRRFYCKERLAGGDDAGNLRAYIHSPNEELFVVWGDVGIGKSWFLRYELLVSDFSVETGDIAAEVIDFLQGTFQDAPELVMTQLCPVLDKYLNEHGGGAETAMRMYRQSQLDRRKVEGANSEQAFDTVLSEWLQLDDGPEYAQLLLRVIETVEGPPIFIVADNIDKASDADQERLVGLAAQLLRSHRIKIILPLRKTSQALRDRFARLHEHSFNHLTLAPLDMMSMLRLRFLYSRQGTRLAESPPIADGDSSYTFPELFARVEDSEVAELVRSIAGSDARVALMLVTRLLGSDQLKGLPNVSDAEHALACWMLSDTGAVDPVSPFLVNLFDSEEPEGTPGYALIRYRVLEYFASRSEVRAESRPLRRYFDRLGYANERIRDVLLTFMRAGILNSPSGLTPDRIEESDDRSFGILALTQTGRAYWDHLIKMQWYYVTAKRSTRVPVSIIRKNEEEGTEYITHSDFTTWLRKQEDEERQRVRRWESTRGPARVDLAQPSIDAARHLAHIPNGHK
ncbi:hypothetical protein ACFLTM_05650 [Candidatus Bipolaricaulota bacterium]